MKSAHSLLCARALLVLLCAVTAPLAASPGQLKNEGTQANDADTQTLREPYPRAAAGWGPELGGTLMMSRWAEDWTSVRSRDKAPSLKSIEWGDGAGIALSAELRLRQDHVHRDPMSAGRDSRRDLVRGVFGADLTLDPQFRVYGEVASGYANSASALPANFQNTLSLQQLFIDLRTQPDATMLFGTMIGRQEFADGPRQLISLSDGPNLHRSWNGVRLYAHRARFRLGAFDFRATRLGPDAFDEHIRSNQRLRGINASLVVSPAAGPDIYFDPFWLHTETPEHRDADRIGLDRRDTFGARLWGRRGRWRFDWTAVQQRGDFMDRRIDAWGVFAMQSVQLSEAGWKPRLTTRIDLASGNRAGAPGTLTRFNPLYASSSYLGEGQFLGLGNLTMLTPGLLLTPSSQTRLAFEYGWARRRESSDAVYAGGLRAYPDTRNTDGHDTGRLLRVQGAWTPTPHSSVALNLDRFHPGQVLQRAGVGAATYASVAVTFRY